MKKQKEHRVRLVHHHIRWDLFFKFILKALTFIALILFLYLQSRK